MTWKAVPGYEGYYEAHDELKAVRSLDRVIFDRRGQCRILRGRTLTGSPNGTKTIILSRDGKQEFTTAAEVLARTFSTVAA
jgi:hypothetical protein